MKNHDHMLHCSWDMASDRCNYFSFWVIFCPFTSLTAQKIKMKKKQKKNPGDIILYKCTKNHDHMLYCSWDTARDRCNLYFSFWAIFCCFTPGDIIILYMLPKLWSDDVQLLRYGAWRMDGQMEKVIYRGGCPT